MSLKFIKANFILDNLGGPGYINEGPKMAKVSLGEGILPVVGSFGLLLLTACLGGL